MLNPCSQCPLPAASAISCLLINRVWAPCPGPISGVFRLTMHPPSSPPYCRLVLVLLQQVVTLPLNLGINILSHTLSPLTSPLGVTRWGSTCLSSSQSGQNAELPTPAPVRRGSTLCLPGVGVLTPQAECKHNSPSCPHRG